MAEQMINIKVEYDNNNTHDYSETYNPSRSVDDYKAEKVEETKKSNNTKIARVIFVRVTQHDKDGNYLMDEFDNVTYTYLFHV